MFGNLIIRDIYYYVNAYALQAFMLALTTGMLSYCSAKKRYSHSCRKSDIIRHTLVLVVGVAYAYMVVGITFLSRETDTIRYVNLNLFSTFYKNRTAARYIMENIIMFIPYGVIYGMEYGREKLFRIGFIVKRAVLTSMVIELSQYIMARGRTEADDVLTNTAGAVIGWEAVRFILYIINLKKKH